MNKCWFIAAALMWGSLAHAQKARHEDWVVDLSSGTYSEAYTSNDSNSVLGIYCVDKCMAYVDPNINCDVNSKYNLFVNSSMGAVAMDATCVHLKDRQIRVLDKLDLILEQSKSGDRIGFAFALKDGSFKVVRFSMNGSATAIRRALSHIIEKNRTGTRDRVL
jgi:hypothetical protein